MSEAFKSPVQKRRAEPSTLTDHERAILATEMAAQDLANQDRVTMLEASIAEVKNQIGDLNKYVRSIESTTKISDTISSFWNNMQIVLRDSGFQMLLTVAVVAVVIGFCVSAGINSPPNKMCAETKPFPNGIGSRKTHIIVTRSNGETISYNDACATEVTLDVREEVKK